MKLRVELIQRKGIVAAVDAKYRNLAAIIASKHNGCPVRERRRNEIIEMTVFVVEISDYEVSRIVIGGADRTSSSVEDDAFSISTFARK